MTNLNKTMNELSVIVGVTEMVKAGPPREGLVPQSGDPEHPGKWVKPSESPKNVADQDPKEGAAEMTDDELKSARGFLERLSHEHGLSDKDRAHGFAIQDEIELREGRVADEAADQADWEEAEEDEEAKRLGLWSVTKTLGDINSLLVGKAGPLPPHFGDPEEEEDVDKGRSALLAEIAKAGPPREGLVPQSGNPDKPGRWIKPGSQEGGGETPGEIGERTARREAGASLKDPAAAGQEAARNDADDRAVSSGMSDGTQAKYPYKGKQTTFADLPTDRKRAVLARQDFEGKNVGRGFFERLEALARELGTEPRTLWGDLSKDVDKGR